jgi:hypothetical protein
MEYMITPITISLEVELGWGTHDLPDGPRSDMFSSDRKKETEILRALLSRCDELALPLTFDVVGHLMEEKCDGSHDGPHRQGWFDADPGENMTTEPLFYASGIVDTITKANVKHEIATHTYSHVLFDEIEAAVVDWELHRVREVHDNLCIRSPVSLVPPRHREPPIELLSEHGVNVVRVPIERIDTDRRRKLNSFNRILGRSHPSGKLETEGGVVLSYTSFEPSLTAPFLPNGQCQPHPIFRTVPLRLRERLQSRYLSDALYNAIESDTHLHLWSHLGNLANDYQWSVVNQFLSELAEAVQQHDAEVMPMAALPGWVS